MCGELLALRSLEPHLWLHENVYEMPSVLAHAILDALGEYDFCHFRGEIGLLLASMHTFLRITMDLLQWTTFVHWKLLQSGIFFLFYCWINENTCRLYLSFQADLSPLNQWYYYIQTFLILFRCSVIILWKLLRQREWIVRENTLTIWNTVFSQKKKTERRSGTKSGCNLRHSCYLPNISSHISISIYWSEQLYKKPHPSRYIAIHLIRIRRAPAPITSNVSQTRFQITPRWRRGSSNQSKYSRVGDENDFRVNNIACWYSLSPFSNTMEH